MLKSSSGPSAAFAAFVSDHPADWPSAAWHEAARVTVDIIGCMLADSTNPATRAVRTVAQGWGAGPASTIGVQEGLSAPHAALINGTAAHALDFDDNLDPAKTHATAAVMPALIALGEERGLSSRAVLDAYIASVQVMTRLGQAINPVHRARGWHATATVGTIGAAAGCARLIGLKGDRARHAINLSTSLAGGSMVQFGTMTKPAHAGLSCQRGIMAAQLAEGGLQASAEVFDGSTGLAQLMVGPDYPEFAGAAAKAGPGGLGGYGEIMSFAWADMETPLGILKFGLKLKRFPNCASAHRSMDGLLDLMQAHGFAADDVKRIEVHAPCSHLNNLMYTDPKTPPQARFSLEYALAVLLLTGDAVIADFEPAAIAQSEIRAAMQRVQRVPVDKYEGDFPTQVHVFLKDGRHVEQHVAMPKGSVSNPLSDAEIAAKFAGCAAQGLRNDIPDGVALLSALKDDLPLNQLGALLRRAMS